MPTEILMPALSPTMTEGTLAKWVVKEGDSISAGDVIAEIETDKATMEVEAVDEGTIGKIIVSEGSEGVAVNSVIALLLEEGEDAAALANYTASAAGGAAPAPQEAPPSAVAAAEQKTAAPAANALPAEKTGGRIFASPLARRIAQQEGLELSLLKGSGPKGRIVKADVEAALAAGTGKALPATATPAADKAAAPAKAASATLSKDQVAAMAGNAPYTEIAHTSMRKTIAKRLTEAKQDIPHFYLTIDCELDKLLATRKELNGKAEGLKISVNDFIIRATALALQKVPTANASWSDDCVLQWQNVDVSVAVAIPGGLITPIIKNADQKGLATISAEMKDLANRAKDGKLMPEEYQGGGFSISNLGMFGIREFSAVINPPQGCILAVGKGEQRPLVKDGSLSIATMMSCTLSVDHRVVDGAVGAEFLAEFKKLIEDPLAMLL